MCRWPVHVACTSVARLGSCRTQLAHGKTRSTTITCPKRASHLGHLHITLGLLVARIGIMLNISSLADRVIVTGRILQNHRLILETTTAQEVVDLTQVAKTGGEADADEDGRGTSDSHQHMRMPYRMLGRNSETRDRYTFSGYAVHPRCALITAEGAGDAGEDRFGWSWWLGRLESPGRAQFTRRASNHGST